MFGFLPCENLEHLDDVVGDEFEERAAECLGIVGRLELVD